MVTGWRVEVRDTDLSLAGVCDVWTSLAVKLRHRRAGGWTLTLPAGHDQAALFTEGRGVIVWAPWSQDAPLLTGPLTKLTAVTPDATNPAMLTVDGIDDTAQLGDRIVLPDPTSDPDDQNAEAYYTVTGKAEYVLRDLVDVNCGHNALGARIICDADPTPARMGIDAIQYGSERTVSARFDNLLTLLGEVAATDNLTFRLVQPAATADLWFEVGQGVDRSAQVRLSQLAGTLVSATATIGAPTATSVLVAGGGEGTDRLLVERVNAGLGTTWNRRVEVFRDARDTVDTTEMEQRGDETLADAAATAGIAVDAMDGPGAAFTPVLSGWTDPILWRTDYERGLVDFQDSPWNSDPTAPEVTDEQARSGSYSGRYVIPGGGSRCENITRMADFTEGDDVWFAFSVKLGDDVVPDSDDWQIVVQWKNNGWGSPPLELSLNGDGNWQIGGGWGWPGVELEHDPKLDAESLGAAATGVWVDWRVHVVFSADPDVGYVEVWRDGLKVLEPWKPPGGTLYPDLDSYLKIGYYRSTSHPDAGTVYHDDWKVYRVVPGQTYQPETFGVHYGIGDLVTVEVGDQTWKDMVAGVDVSVTAADGTVVKPLIGNPDNADQTTPAIYRRVRDLTRRLEALERRQ